MKYLLLFLFLVTGCATVQDKIPGNNEPLYKYQGDMEIWIDGGHFKGMAVTKLEPKKNITIRSKAKLDLLVTTSCSRYDKVEKIDFKEGWFGTGGKSAKQYTFSVDLNGKEQEGTCPFYVQAFDMGGVTDWGYITWRTDETIRSTLDCNVRQNSYAGHSVCQALAGTEQGISFQIPIKYFEADPNCNMKRDTDKAFSFRPGMGFCYATFSDGKEWHRLTALGFERAQVRGE